MFKATHTLLTVAIRHILYRHSFQPSPYTRHIMHARSSSLSSASSRTFTNETLGSCGCLRNTRGSDETQTRCRFTFGLGHEIHRRHLKSIGLGQDCHRLEIRIMFALKKTQKTSNIEGKRPFAKTVWTYKWNIYYHGTVYVMLGR